ncbi:unnamed protein product, partial [Durusdinium trenchii]
MIDESALRKAEGHVEQSSQSQRDHLDRLQMLRREHDIPAALGNRAESVGHKCAAMLPKFALRVPVDGRKDMLEKFTSSYFSFCADLGVEIGIGEFTVENLQSLLPHWLIGSNLESDVPAEATCLDAKDKGTPAVLPASMELEPDVAFLDVSEARSVVPPARPPPQESDGACLDVCEARSAVPPELPPPQNGDKFLPNALIVIRFCIRLKRVMPVIRAVWDERRYLYGIDSVQGEHGDGHGHGQGKRLPELAAYGAEKILLSLASSGVGALFVSHRHVLSPEQWQNVLSDFELGKGQAIVQFRLKFDWSNRLPYKMALLAFGDQALQTM